MPRRTPEIIADDTFVLTKVSQVLLDLTFGSASRLSNGRIISNYNTRMPASCFPDPHAVNRALLKASQK